MPVASTTVYRNGNQYYTININTATVNNNYSTTQAQVTIAGNIYFHNASYWGVRLTGYIKNSEGDWLQIGSQTGYTTDSFSYCCNISNSGFLSKKAGSYTSQVKFVATSEIVDGYGGVTETGECTYDITINSLQSYNITYNANGGNATSTPTAQTKYYSLTLTLATKTPTKNSENVTKRAVFNFNDNSTPNTIATVTKAISYTFSKWNTNANGNGTNYSPGANFTANANTTLYAQWQTNNNSFPVTLPAASRTGYDFLGWYTAENWGQKAGDATKTYYLPTAAATTTLYAHWNKISLYQIDSNDIVDRVSTFGGTNLLVNSKQMQLGTSSWANGVWRLAGNANMTKSRIEITDSPIGTCGAFQLVGTQTTTTDTSCFGIDSWQPWTTNDYYTISMYARVISGTGMAGIQNGSGYGKTLIRTNADTTWGSYACLTLTSNWQRIWVVFLPTATSSNIYIGGAGTDATIQMCGVKIEKGNKPTDWTPAPQDLVTYDSTNQSLVFFQ